jgi:phosphatidylinositol alpha-1,6-mannosyltransferase
VAVSTRRDQFAAEKTKVWVLSPEVNSFGGTERCVLEQCKRWRDRFDLRLYAMRVEAPELNDVPIRFVPYIKGPHLLRFLSWLVANYALRWWDARRGSRPEVIFSPGINCLDADAIHVHIVFENLWRKVRGNVFYRLRRGQTAARTVHRLVYYSWLRLLEQKLYSGAATLWANSHGAAAELETKRRLPPGSVPVVPCGVDVVRFSPERRRDYANAAHGSAPSGGRQSRVLLAVGNDAHAKGLDVAVKALSYLPKDVCLAIAGRADEASIGRWAGQSKVQERVLRWPHSPDILGYYAAADLLVAPSREDSFHLPALEALACGLPVVVSSRAGVAELLDDGRHAAVLEDPEDPRALAEGVMRVLEDPDLAERLRTEGRALAERCSWDANADRCAELIEREARTPRMLVLAPDPGGIGGIQRASRMLLEVVSGLFGADRVGLLSLWHHEETKELPCRVLGRRRRRSTDGPLSRFARLGYTLGAIRTARRWRRRLVIFCCHCRLAPVAWACARVTGAPYGVWCHGVESWGPLRASVLHALRRADVVVAVSRFTARRVESAAGLPSGSVKVVPLAAPPAMVASNRRRSAPNGRPRVLSVARLTPGDAYKGIDTLLYAWPRVLARLPEAELVIVGGGSDRARLERIADILDLHRSVEFAGVLTEEELRRAYEEASVFALPGRCRLEPRPEGEGFGLVYLEAGASGLPVIAGRGGGAAEAVSHGATGILVDADNQPEVVGALLRLLTERELAHGLGENGRLRATRDLSPQRFGEQMEDVIDSLVKAGRG